MGCLVVNASGVLPGVATGNQGVACARWRLRQQDGAEGACKEIFLICWWWGKEGEATIGYRDVDEAGELGVGKRGEVECLKVVHLLPSA